MAHAWKACWVYALGGSNPPPSARNFVELFQDTKDNETGEKALVEAFILPQIPAYEPNLREVGTIGLPLESQLLWNFSNFST